MIQITVERRPMYVAAELVATVEIDHYQRCVLVTLKDGRVLSAEPEYGKDAWDELRRIAGAVVRALETKEDSI